MTHPDPPRHRVPGAHLDGTPSTITVTTTPARQHVVIAMHDDQPAALAIAATDATSLLTLLCEGRDGMIAVVDLNARIFVIPAPAGVGPAADTGTDAGGTMLLFAATAALAPAARIPCAGRGSVAILHTSAQIDDLVEALADVLSCVEPPADP